MTTPKSKLINRIGLVRLCKLGWCHWQRQRTLRARAERDARDLHDSRESPPAVTATAPALVLPAASAHESPEPAPYPLHTALLLQGGGSHGAFTWGVLHQLLEDEAFDWGCVKAVAGTSAGAMNAAVLSCGFAQGGREGAKQALAAFWKDVSANGSAENNPFSPRFMRQAAPAMWDWWSHAIKQFSPYQVNPLNLNPLRDVLDAHVNFTTLRRFEAWELMICATHLRTGLPRYFGNQDLTMDALLASACLPMVFQAVEVGGHAYWDGGYSANPPLAPFIERGMFDELVLVRINVSQRKERPTSAADIMTRASEISFSASLNAELRMLDSLTQLAHARKANALLSALPSVEVIAADDALQAFDAESKMDTDWEFLNQLHNIGRKAAKSWLKQRYKLLT